MALNKSRTGRMEKSHVYENRHPKKHAENFKTLNKERCARKTYFPDICYTRNYENVNYVD